MVNVIKRFSTTDELQSLSVLDCHFMELFPHSLELEILKIYYFGSVIQVTLDVILYVTIDSYQSCPEDCSSFRFIEILVTKSITQYAFWKQNPFSLLKTSWLTVPSQLGVLKKFVDLSHNKPKLKFFIIKVISNYCIYT